MRVLILGASGLLGQALMREWSGDEVVGLSSRDVDIRDAAKVLRGGAERCAPNGSCCPPLTPMWTVARAIRNSPSR